MKGRALVDLRIIYQQREAAAAGLPVGGASRTEMDVAGRQMQ
jgi:hypothetical protein